MFFSLTLKHANDVFLCTILYIATLGLDSSDDFFLVSRFTVNNINTWGNGSFPLLSPRLQNPPASSYSPSLSSRISSHFPPQIPETFVLFSSCLVAGNGHPCPGPVLPCNWSWIVLGLDTYSHISWLIAFPKLAQRIDHVIELLIVVRQSGLSSAWTVFPYMSSSVTLVTIIQCIDHVIQILTDHHVLTCNAVPTLTPILSPRTHIIFHSVP